MRATKAIGVGLFLGCVSAAPALNIETVPVGNPGNAGEWSGESYGGYGPDRICGAVDYTYNIGKYEVTAGQYTEFLNAVAGVDTYGLYSTDMWARIRGCKIERTGTSGSYTYSVAPAWADRPVNYVSWGDAARFCNWLHNGQPTGAQGLATTEDGAYYLNGATSGAALRIITRQAKAVWFIPSEHEWYKAAYHKNDPGAPGGDYFDYPTSSNTAPGRDMTDASGNNANYYTGSGPYPIDSPYYTTVAGEFQNSDSRYGTYDQAGNVSEWNEALIGLDRGVRGGSFESYYDDLHAAYRSHRSPVAEDHVTGFRVARHEPVTIHVDDDAPPGGDGVTWETAYADLQDALDAVILGDEIRVAAGTYRPDRGTYSRQLAFEPPIGVGLYGGFAGLGGPNPDERDVAAHESILSGDLFGDDGPGFVNYKENSYVIVKCDDGQDCTFDGFTVRGSTQHGAEFGGGNPTIRDCTFRENRAQVDGAGMSCSDAATVVNCVFSGNYADRYGGGVRASGQTPLFVNCIFKGNEAGLGGGGLRVGSATLVNCAFLANWAWGEHGGGMYSGGVAAPTLIGCTFGGNWSWYQSGGGLLHENGSQEPSTVTLTNCVFWGNGSPHGTSEEGQVDVRGRTTLVFNYCCVQGWTGTWGGVGSIGDDPLFVSLGIPGSPDDNLRLLPGSPCIDMGSTAAASADETDLDGHDRIINCAVDMGAYELDTGEPLAMCGVRCRKAHAGLGELDVVLPPAGGTECRAGGLTKVVVPFNRYVRAIDGTPDGTEIAVSVGALGAVSIVNHELTITMTGVPDATCQTITLTGLADSAGEPLNGGDPVGIDIAVLAGNTNGDDRTNLADMAQVKLMNHQPLLDAWGQPIPENVRFDVNLDGAIHLADVAAVKLLNGGGPVVCP